MENLLPSKMINGMPNINVFDFSQKIGCDLWTDFVQSLTDTGIVDGLFDDKSDILAMWNETGLFWQICEWGTGRDTWNISWNDFQPDGMRLQQWQAQSLRCTS